MKSKSRLLMFIASVSLLSSVAQADENHGRFISNEIVMRAATVSFPAGVWRTALSTVVSRFYNNPSDQWFTQTWNDGSVGLGNGQCEVWFSSDDGALQGAPAITYWWFDWWTGMVNEADVLFDNRVPYTTSMNKTSLWPYGGALRPFETTAMHEYGHAAGLSHENDEYNIMGQDWTHIHCNGTTCRSYVGEDACDGLVKMYGIYGGDIQDVSTTLFKRTGASGEYSAHGQCIMRDAATGLELSSSTFEGQKRYNVSIGQQVRVEFTYENEGETSQQPNLGFYVSSNSTISTGDTRIATTNGFNLNRDSVFLSSKTLTIPRNLTSGVTYFLGVIVDYDNLIGEVDSSNNAAYHIIRIKLRSPNL